MHKRIFRVARGHVLHVIHETKTGNHKTHDVYVLCRNDPVSGERDKGKATCPECLELDDPCNVMPGEMNILTRIIAKDSSLRFDSNSTAYVRLIKRDLITRDLQLTRRGQVLALDWIERPAAAADGTGINHARRPLSDMPRCGMDIHFDRMSVDRYAQLRGLDLPVTCIACLYER